MNERHSTGAGLLALYMVVVLAAISPAAAAAQLIGAPATADAAPVWLGFNEALDAAGTTGKKVLVDVWSAKCGWCARMQREVYTRPELLEYLDTHFETGRLDIDVRTDTIAYMGYSLSSAELSVGLGASGTPTTIFLAPDGTYITRLPGFHDFDNFMQVLRFIGSESFRDMSFEEYVENLAGPESGDIP